jgi:iron chelate uptake ABC transporter, feCT family, permease protein
VSRWLGVTLLGVALTVVILATATVALGVGSASLSVGDVVDVVLRRLALIPGENVTVEADRIVWELRMPRVLGALSVGAALAICGVVLQSLTRNELADPYLLGISSGSTVGVVAVIVFGLSLPLVPESLTLTAAAFGGAILAMVLVLGLATGRSGALPPGRTILAGVAVGQLCAAFTSLSIMVFGERDVSRMVMNWTLGSFAGMRWPNATVMLCCAIASLLVLLFATSTLDAFAFGETSARSLGINVTRARWILLIITALITAATVAVAGPIGFVGLTIPHLVRIATGPGHRTLLPLTALAGAALMLVADTLARTLRPSTEIPIGVITATIGTPVLVFLLRRQAGKT